MTATVIRVEGNIINHPEAPERLAGFLQLQKTPHILTISSIPGLYSLIEKEISGAHQADYHTGFLKRSLRESVTIHPEGESLNIYEARVNKLLGLLKGIHLTGDYSPGLKDQVLSYSEILSAVLVAEKLKQAGLKVTLVQPQETGLLVTSDFGNATCLSLSHPELFTSGTTFVIPGSFGITASGKIARTGKNAADYTAAFLAEQLDAGRLVLWNLSDGFASADRTIIPEAGILERLTYAEASELAYSEHCTLHPRAVEPLLKSHIPIHIVRWNSENFEPETIINSEDHVSERIVKSIAGTDDISVLRLNGPGVGLKPGILARITGKLADSGINIKSVITSQVSINILLDCASGPAASKAAESLGFTAVNEIELLEEVSLIAIVGHGMQKHYGIAARLFSAVAENKINVLLSGSGASDLVSYLVIDSADKKKAVGAIYDAFFES